MTVTKTPILGLFSDESYPMAIERDTDYLTDVSLHTLDILDNNTSRWLIPWASICILKSGPASTRMFSPSYSMKAEALNRLS